MVEYNLVLDKKGKSVLCVKEEYEYNDILQSPEDVFFLINQLFRLGNKAEEYVYLICCNTKMKPVSCFEISHGCVDNSLSEKPVKNLVSTMVI